MTASGQGLGLMFCQVNNIQRAWDKNQEQRGEGKKKKTKNCPAIPGRNGDMKGFIVTETLLEGAAATTPRKERAGRWPWVWRRPCAMRGKSRQPPRPFPWEIPFLEFKMIREILSSAVIAGKYWSILVRGGWICPADSSLPFLARAGKQSSLVAHPACASGRAVGAGPLPDPAPGSRRC